MSNASNMGTLVGRLARDPHVFDNSDGSKKVVFTVYAERNYTTAGGERPADAIPVEAFVSKTVNGLGPYAHIHQGDLVALQTTLQANAYEKNGQKVYETKVVVEDIKFLESRATTQGRLAQRMAAAGARTEAVAAHPAGGSAVEAAPVEQVAQLSAELPFAQA